jgi:hypothetical protein
MEENEELGREVSEGRIHQLECEVLLQKQRAQDFKRQLDGMVVLGIVSYRAAPCARCCANTCLYCVECRECLQQQDEELMKLAFWDRDAPKPSTVQQDTATAETLQHDTESVHPHAEQTAIQACTSNTQLSTSTEC